MEIFVEGPGGRFIAPEGQELQRAREALWGATPIDFANAYIDYTLVDRVELIKFAGRFSALIWLYRTVNEGVTAVSESHAHLQGTGEHRVAGWVGESDLALDEEIYQRQDMLTITAGSIIAASAAALESLATDLLDRSED